MSNIILSFDPASFRNTGWSVFTRDKTTCISGTIVTKEKEPWKALYPIFQEVDKILSKYKPDVVVIEKTSSFSGGFITGQVSNCIGVTLAACGKHKRKVEFVYPTHVKKIVTGNGRAKKADIKKAVRDYLKKETGKDIKFDSEHSCDAAANIICWLKENP